MDEQMDLPELRAELMDTGIDVGDLSEDPLDELDAWVKRAWDLGVHNANAMAVASSDAEGRPSVRNVLYRGRVDGRLAFYTNFDSQKGVELRANPAVEALFSWLSLERQVRVRGTVVQLTDAQSDDYWNSRPRGSQLAALSSDQSRPVPDRDHLERRARTLEAAHEGRDVPRPDHWGGFGIDATRIEFWQGRQYRLHDRLVYNRIDDGWVVDRLAP